MAFPSLNDYKRCIDKNDVKRNAGDDAPEAEYQAPVLYNASTKFVKSKLQKAVDALKSVPDDVPLKKLPDSIRNDVSIEILKAERSILVSFESDEAPAPYQRKNIATSIPNDFCMVSIPQNSFLKLRFSSFLPPFQHEWYSLHKSARVCHLHGENLPQHRRLSATSPAPLPPKSSAGNPTDRARRY